MSIFYFPTLLYIHNCDSNNRLIVVAVAAAAVTDTHTPTPLFYFYDVFDWEYKHEDPIWNIDKGILVVLL